MVSLFSVREQAMSKGGASHWADLLAACLICAFLANTLQQVPLESFCLD